MKRSRHHQGLPRRRNRRGHIGLAERIDTLPPPDTRKRVVAFVAFYAPATSSRQAARPQRRHGRVGRLALIDPAVLDRLRHATDGQLARLLAVPRDQLRAYSSAEHDMSRPLRRCDSRRRRAHAEHVAT